MITNIRSIIYKILQIRDMVDILYRIRILALTLRFPFARNEKNRTQGGSAPERRQR